MAVWMKPGATALTVMLRLATSAASDLVMPIRPGLGGGIIALAGIAGGAHHRGDLDDAAPALFHHAAQHGARQAEGGGEIDRDHLVPFLVLHAHEEIVAGDAGIVDQDVDAARRPRLPPPWAGLRPRRCRRDWPAAMKARAPSSASSCFQRFGAGAGQNHRGALGVQRLGDGAADAAGGAGDECGLSGEVKHQSAFRESFEVGGRIERDGLQAPCRCA